MLKIIKSVIHKIRGLQIVLAGPVSMQKDTYIASSAFFPECNQGIPGCRSKTCFSSRAPFLIIIAVRLQHPVMIRKEPGLLMHVGRFDLFLHSGHKNPEIRIRICRLGDQRHIMGSGIMVIIRKTARIGKMRTGAAQILCFLIHHIRKCGNRSGHMLRESVGRIIGRLQHQGIKGLPDRELFARLKSGIGRVIFQIIHNL